MAILTKRSATADIPRIYDDARYADAASLLRAFQERLNQTERDRQCIEYERHFASREATADGETDKMLRARWAALRRKPAEASASSAPIPDGPSASTPAIAKALAILRGEAVAEAPDYATRLRSLDQQRAGLAAAISEQTEIVDEIANELTYEYAKRLKPAWDALQAEWFRSAQAFAQNTQRVQDLRVAITAAGIRSRADILGMPNVRAPLVLGSETVWDSEISGWRRILERLGILG